MTPVYVVTGRVVFTYQPDGWPVGVITGWGDWRGTFHVEHVIVFPGAPWNTLMRMLRAGLVEAWARGYSEVSFAAPAEFALAKSLGRVAARLGFYINCIDGRYSGELPRPTVAA